MGRTHLAAFALAGTLLAAPAPAQQVPPALQQAFDASYNLDFDRASILFGQVLAADPENSAAYRGAATNVWLRLLFLRGTVTVDEYIGKVSSSDLDLPAPPAQYASGFRKLIGRAVAIGEKAVARRPGSAAAHYDLGAALGLQASYTGSIDGRVFAAMRAARRAYAEHEKALELDPRRRDAGLVVGTYRYIVATLPAPLRWMAYLVGFGGDKQLALRLLQEAASYPGDTQADARFALVLIYNREARYDEALGVIRALERSFPGNRLLWLEEGATALRAKRAREAAEALDAGIARSERDGRPRMPGEWAQWHYKRGVARLLLGNTSGAAEELGAALGDPTIATWVRGRTHTELGKLADLAGDRQRALGEYRMAAALGEKSRDGAAAEEAKRLLKRPYGRAR